MLRYQVNKIAEVNLKENEGGELVNERGRLRHFQQISNTFQLTVTTFNEGEQVPVLDQVATVMDSINAIAESDDTYDNPNKAPNDTYYVLRDVMNEASRWLDILESDDEWLAQIEQRLATTSDLEHKYGNILADVLKYYDKVRKELDPMEIAADSNGDPEQRLGEAEDKIRETGRKLSQVR